jgi:hypothetical protein
MMAWLVTAVGALVALVVAVVMLVPGAEEQAEQVLSDVRLPEVVRSTPATTPSPTPEAAATRAALTTSTPARTPESQSGDLASTAASCPSPEQQRYLDDAKTVSRDLQDTLRRVSEAFQRVRSNPFVAFDGGWRRDVGELLSEVRTNADRLEALEPAPGLEEVDRLLEESAAEIRRMADRGEQAVNDLDVSAASEVNASLERVGDRFERVERLVEALCE